MTTKVTTNHEEIKRWAIDHNGKPQIIDYEDATANTIGLKINFPGPEDDALLSDAYPPKDISWDDFFTIFDVQELAFIYEDRIVRGDASLSYRFIKRGEIDRERREDKQIKF